MRYRLMMVAIVAFVLGAIVSGLYGGEIAGVQARQRQRFEVERANGILSIRDTRLSTCYIAVEGGGILQTQCAF